MDMKHTKGEVTTQKADGAIGIYANLKLLATCWFAAPSHPISEKEAKANSELVTEAFNVTNETNKSPRQLADERSGILEALKWAIADIDRLADCGVSYSMSLGKTPISDLIKEKAKLYVDNIVTPIKKATE